MSQQSGAGRRGVLQASEDHFLDYFRDYMDGRCGRFFYAIFPKEEPEKFIGYVGLHPGEFDWDTEEDRCEIEFHIAREYRNKAYAEEASKELLHHFFAQEVFPYEMKCTELYAKALSRNIPSIRVLEKLGFRKTREGTVRELSEFIDWDDESSRQDLVSEFRLSGTGFMQTPSLPEDFATEILRERV